MIVNHKYGFIFVKTRKTAGTSIEIALSQYCGDGDIITPITAEDEATRRQLGYRGPQNYLLPYRQLGRSELFRAIVWRNRKRFYHHDTASFMREYLDANVWNTYFKFCFERNPYDKAVSRYFWGTREPRPPVAEYCDTVPAKLLSDWNSYTINDSIAVDFVGQYDNLANDLELVRQKLGLHKPLELPRAKGAFRTDRRHYSEILDDRARARIELVCAKEIVHFGYKWRAATRKDASV